ncbi:TPA: three component ABC system middle component [Vibrio parahaemolyticus]
MNRILNNEALGLLAIQSILSCLKSINIASAYLIIPLAFDRKIRSHLKRKNTTILSVQELVTMKSDYFIGFNEKFTDSLLITTNAIVMGRELGMFELKEDTLVGVSSVDITDKKLGRKVDDIILATNNLSVILSEEPEALYSLLRLKI